MLQLDRKAIYRALEDRETYGTVLHAIALATYGEELYTMVPAQIYLSLQEDFGIWPHEDNESKLMAVIIAVSQPYFYTDLTVFQATCRTLTTGDPGLSDLGIDDTTLLEVLWGRYEVSINAEDIELSEEILQFVETSIDEEENDSEMTEDDVLTHFERIMKHRAIEMIDQLKACGFDMIPEMPDLI